MLQVRSPPLRSRLDWASLRDAFAASDQGLLRLQMAVRGTLSVFLTTLVAVMAGRWFGFDPVECAGGITLSMMAPFLMREPTRVQRQQTLLMLVLPALIATVGTTLLHGHGPAGDSVFLLLVFLCFLFGPVDPRAIGLGLVAVIVTYVGLYLELPPATLPLQMASLLLSLPVIALACFVIVPMDATATLRRSVAAVQARAAQVIRQAHALGNGEVADAGALRRAVSQLNQAALVADDQLAFFEPGAAGAVRSRLVNVELWTARLTHHLETAHLRDEKLDERWSRRLALHARRVARGGRYSTAPDNYQPNTLIAMLVGLGQAVFLLNQALREQGAAAAPPPAPPAPRGPLAWRLSARVTLAAGLAMAGGMALSPQRWFWAVITVYVVFLNVRSRGETIYKGVQRLAGTLLGIVSGLLIALTLKGDGPIEAGVLLLSIFGMYYTFMISYTLGIFFVTVMLGLLYGMLGAPLETVLLLRLEETAIGAAAAIVVAAFVLPDSTTKRVRGAGRAVLTALAAAVQASAGVRDGNAASPSAAMRQVDRMLADLRLALAPVTATRALVRRPPIERPLSALLDCVHWTRVVAAEAASSAEPVDTGRLQRAAQRLEALAQDEPAPAAPSAADPAPDAVAQLERAITTMEQRRSLRAYDAYTLDS